MKLRSVVPRAALSFSQLALNAGCRPGEFDDPGRWHAADGMVETPGDLPDASVPPADAGAPGNDGGAGMDGGCAAAPAGGRTLRVAGAPVELARLTNPEGVATRILGPTARVGGRRVWTFSTTRGTQPAPAKTPGNYPTSALTARAGDPPWTRPLDASAAWTLDELIAQGTVPRALLQLRDDEAPGINLAASSFLDAADEGGAGLMFVQRNALLGAPDAVWLADLASPSGVAERRAQPLFTAPDPMFALAAMRTPSDLKVFACTRASEASFGASCVVARAPLDRVDDRGAYQVYGGHGTWLSDLTKGEPVLTDVAEDFSVSWNAYLGRFLAVSSAPLANEVRLRTAPALEGPWSSAEKVKLPEPKAFVTMRAREVPGIAQRCERRIIVSYWSPTSVPDPSSLPTEGDVVLTAIDLE